MNEQFQVLQAIYSRQNELIYDHQTETLTFNAFDNDEQTIGFSVIIYPNQSIIWLLAMKN